MTKETTCELFYNYFTARGFGLKFNVWSIMITYFLRFSQEYASFTYTCSFYLASLTKLTELFYFNEKITANFQKKSISLLLYPLIFQSVKRNLLVSAKPKRSVDPILKLQTSILKSIS